MAKVGAQRAADLTGRSKSTIQRAMKAGKLSYEVDNAGRRVIDVAELDRAFGLIPQNDTPNRNSVLVEAELEKATAMLETERLKMRIRLLEDQLDLVTDQVEDLKTQRDQWQKQAQQVLITSQYSQKQAEELKAELQEKNRKEEMRRAYIEKQRRAQQSGNKTMSTIAPSSAAPERKQPNIELQRLNASITAVKNIDIQNLWKKVRGQNESQNQDAQINDSEVSQNSEATSTEETVKEQIRNAS
jgi:hypothetical protein